MLQLSLTSIPKQQTYQLSGGYSPPTMAQGLRSWISASVRTGKLRQGQEMISLSAKLKKPSRKAQANMHQPMLMPTELPSEMTGNRAPSPRPGQTKPDRCSFLTILKLREINRRKRRTPEAE